MQTDTTSKDAFLRPLKAFGPMTESQQEIFSACQLGPEASLAYNESVTLSVEGRIDTEAMQRALEALRLRHDSLRMVFAQDGSGFFIQVDTDSSQDIHLNEAVSEAELRVWQQKAVSEVFDLSVGPLLRATVLADSRQSFIILTAHHMVCDGWSIAIMMRDLAQLYTAQIHQTQAALPEPPSFVDFAQELMLYQHSDQAAVDQRYWLESLVRNDSVPAMDMPHDLKRPKFRSFHSRRLDVELPWDLMKSLKALAAQERSSFFMILLASYKALLWKILDDDVVVATPAAAQAQGSYDLVAHAVHTMPLRTSIEASQTFRSLLRSVRTAVLDANDHQRCTYGLILQSLPLERDSSRIPLAPILFNVDRKFDKHELSFAGLLASYDSNPRSFEAFELFHNITESQGSVRLECQYNTDLYSAEWIQSHVDSFITLLQSIVKSPDAPLSELAWAPLPQLEQLFFEWNANYTALDHKTFLDLFDRRVEEFSDKVAVVANDRSLTYRQLQELSHQWADILVRKGLKPGDLVGVAIGRNCDLLACLLGILKAGGAYVPMDPNYPKDRLAYMLQHAAIQLILTESGVVEQLPLSEHLQILCVDQSAEILALASSQIPVTQGQIGADDAAYVIFTSGSTGLPKGVVVAHGGVMNFLQSMQQKPGLSKDDRLLSVTTLSFDIAVLEFYLPLMVGASTILASREQAIDGFALKDLLDRQNVSCMQATPATWSMLIDSNWSGRPLKALVGGEALSVDLAEKLLARVSSLWNMYGPTETTVWSSCRQILQGATIDIGWPIMNTSVYVLDRFGQHVPWNMPGELFIGGMGVSLGYLGREDLTRERFSPLLGVPDSGRIYRTGDLVRMDAKGCLHYLRRNDNQVKVRGFRIELGEIEAALARHQKVRTALVLVREDLPGDPRLVGYATTTQAEVDSAALQSWLSEQLPAYMLPQHLMVLEDFPLLPNGKVDRKRLPKPGIVLGADSRVDQARGPLEEMMAGLWSEVLGLDAVPCNSSFYALGGHSLLAIRMLQKLQILTGKVVPLKMLMEQSTIQKLAKALGASQTELKPIPALTNGRRGALSLMQERIYFLDRLDPLDSVHILPDGRKIEGDLQVDAFLKAIGILIDRHPQMRALLVETPSGPEIEILDAVDWNKTLIDLSEEEPTLREQKLALEMKNLATAPLVLSRDPMFRIKLFKLAPQVYVLGTGFHHFIWDGWCFDIFWTELHAVYHELIAVSTGATLPVLATNYLDFSLWHRNQSQSSEIQNQRAFWTEYLRDLELLELPTDWPRPARRSSRGKRVEFQWPLELTLALEKLGRQDQATSFYVMLALFKLLLADISGQKDIQIGAPVQGRDHPDVSQMIGYFVNTLVVRTKVEASQTFREFLRDVKTSMESAIRHQDLPFEEILAHTPVRPDASRTSLYSVMFGYQDTSNRLNDWHGITLKQFSLVQESVGSDLMLWVRKNARGIEAGFDFRSDLFSEERIRQWIRDLTALAQAVLAQPNLAVQDLLVEALRRDGPTLPAGIAESAEVPAKMPEIFYGTQHISAELYEQRLAMAQSLLQNAKGQRLVLSLEDPGYALPLLHAAVRSGHSLRILAEGMERKESNLVRSETDPWTATFSFEDDTDSSSNSAMASLQFADGTKLFFQPKMDALNLKQHLPQTDSPGDFHVDLAGVGPQQLTWVLAGLQSGCSLRLHKARRSSSHHLLAAWTRRTSGVASMTLGELVNLSIRGWQAPAELTLLVSLLESDVTQGLLQSIATWKSPVLFVISAETQIGYLAMARFHQATSELVWQPWNGSLAVVDEKAMPLSSYRRGRLRSSVWGMCSWWSERRDQGLRLYCKNPARSVQGGLLSRDEDRLMGLGTLPNVLYVHLDKDEEKKFTRAFVVSQATQHQHMLQQRMELGRHGPSYLRAETTIVADHLPLDVKGGLDKDQIKRLIDQEIRDRTEAPRTFAEKCLRDIWSQILGRNDISRDSNFFELGGHSLLPLLVIQRIEAQTGKRLDLGLFLTQSLAGLAPHCGFDESQEDGASVSPLASTSL